MDVTIGDQQATSHQLAWLAGIWDGEGTFGIYRGSNGHYAGRLTLSNTDAAMINEIVKIFDSLGIKGHLWEEERPKLRHKNSIHITLNKLASVKAATEAMLPYLVSKKPRAELLLRFINSRLEYKPIAIRDEKTGQILGIKKQGYSLEEETMYEQMRKLNAKGK